ncbi:MAG TPA: NAD-dependent epimerase/dehydratase family protein [Solirubrobacteraceae bacterium]|jgi:CDP-glucose 4,6-dehydratase|nr:NAD-dependent epimerase/dehydratase family protein [Solirubrobacteraceae bacterium]
MAANWAGTRVLFTGAQGFIGSWVTERLLDEGAEVFVLDRPPAELSRFRLRGLHERCRPVAADLLDPASLRRTLDAHGVDAVFHLAAAAIVGSAADSPLRTYEVNVRGTWNLLEACRLAEAPPRRVVVASTDKAYGAHEELPYRESHALAPRFPYDTSKACADLIARSYAHTFGLPVAVTRFGNVFGGGDFNFSRLIPGTIRALLEGRRPALRSGGLMERDYLYAEDAAGAYLAVAESLDRPDLRGRAWNASIGAPVSVLEVVGRLAEIAGTELEPDVQGDGTPHGELTRQWLDSSAIATELGWTPAWDLQDGLDATYRWYERSSAAPRPVAHPPAAP